MHLRNRVKLTSKSRTTAVKIALLAITCLALMPGQAASAQDETDPEIENVRPRHIGYGISVGPHLDSRPDLLNQMGLDWVKLYDTAQIADYPRQHVLYRVDVRGYPDDIRAWEQGLYALAGELRARGVEAVEIGNEANLALEWGGHTPDPRLFTDTLRRAYRIFKEVAPEIVVVAGGLAPTSTLPDRSAVDDLEFAQQMLNYGAGRYFDAWGYHPYGFNQPPEADPLQHELVFRRTERMYQLLLDNGIRDRQIWITEFGWVRDPAEEGVNCRTDVGFNDFVWMSTSQDVQANYTARAFEYAETNWPWVGPMFLWNLNWNTYQQAYEPICSHLRWFSVLDGKGAPLPVFYAVQNLEKRPPEFYTPKVGALVVGLTKSVEAGCLGPLSLGSFTVLNTGYPGEMEVEVDPVNGPGRPVVWTSTATAKSGTPVEVLVDPSGIDPGLHMIAVNLRTVNSPRISSQVVRGWLLIHYPSSDEPGTCEPPPTPEPEEEEAGDG
jgi:hypothetical protein